MSRKVTLFYWPTMANLAHEIVELSNGKIKLGNIFWNIFPDSWPDLFIADVGRCRGKKVALLMSFETPADIFPQLSVANHLIGMYGVRELKIVLPYFPPGTMERVQKSGEVATAATLASLFSTLPLTKSGPVQLIFFDIHALQNLYYFHCLSVQSESCVGTFRDMIEGDNDEDIAVALPDDGSFKRNGRKFVKHPQIVCDKKRDGEKRIVVIKEGDPKGKRIKLIDDLAQTCGTLLECSKVLMDAGALEVEVYITHGVFPKESWKKFLKPDCPIKKVVMANTCPWSSNLSQEYPDKFEIVSIAPQLTELILQP